MSTRRSSRVSKAPVKLDPSSELTSRKRVRAKPELDQSTDDDQSTNQSIKRSRAKPAKKRNSDESTDNDQSINRLQSAVSPDRMTAKLFDYSFIVGLIVDHLSDHDVLINLILTSHAVNRSIDRYQVKTEISRTINARINQSVLEFIKLTDKTSELPGSRTFLSPSHKRLLFKSIDMSTADQSIMEKLPAWLPKSVTKMKLTFSAYISTSELMIQVTESFDNVGLSQISELEYDSRCQASQTSPIGRLPDHIKSLAINVSPSVVTLPPSVEKLHLIQSDQSFDICNIPNKVKELKLSGFDLSTPLMPGVFPHGLVKLSITNGPVMETRLFSSIIPSTVTDLTLDYWHDTLVPGCFSAGLKRLELLSRTPNFALSIRTNQQGDHPEHILRVIPDSVTHLILSPEQEPTELQVGDLPPKLRVLDLGGYNLRLRPGTLPSTLEELTIRSGNGGKPLEAGAIPHGVTSLRLLQHVVKTSCKPIPAGVIPSSVVYLDWEYGNATTQLVVGSIPSSVKTLIFDPPFNRSLPLGFIPEGVRALTFGGAFKGTKPLEAGIIPFGVKYLRFGKMFDNSGQPLAIGVIPPTVTHLYFPRNSMFTNGYTVLVNAIPTSVEVLELPAALTLEKAADRPLPKPKKEIYRRWRWCDEEFDWINASASDSDPDHEWFTYWEMRQHIRDNE